MDGVVNRLSEAWVATVGRTAMVWAWPLVNLHNRLTAFAQLPAPGLMGGVVPVAPPNYVAMLHDYITPDEKMVACPNQDVVYGFGPLAPGREPVVVQVPDFGDRFWVYQLCDQRTDGFAELGAMYDTAPGNYLVVAEGWDDDVPPGVTGVLTCPTAVGICIPRVFLNETADDRAAIQPLINQIAVYPLGEFDGSTKIVDWAAAPTYPAQATGDSESQWVFPEQFAEQLPTILDEVPPRPGEEAFYDQLRQVADAIAADADLRAAFTAAAQTAAAEIVDPLFQFHRYGQQLPGNWTTITNNANFGTDYLTRAAAAKSNIFVNKAVETRYFYGDLDANGDRLNGAHDYTVTFPADDLPPVRGFWSLTLYNEHHFFHPNDLGRYSLGTKNTGLTRGPDGSLTLHAQATPPTEPAATPTGSPLPTATSPSTCAPTGPTPPSPTEPGHHPPSPASPDRDCGSNGVPEEPWAQAPGRCLDPVPRPEAVRPDRR